MDYAKIKKTLSTYEHVKVDIYINYLKFLETEKDKDKQIKNKWFAYFKDDEAIDLFSKVAKDNVYIDGETITLSNRGKVIVSYNYQAYKNLVLNIYPETIFDVQLVYDGDSISFKKESGKIIYSHSIKDPFATKKTIIGAYCVMKNNRGEILETINMEDIKKMQSTAQTQKIWDAWFSEMVLKSVIKRACKRNFRDIITNAETLDNENNDVERVGFDIILQKEIENATTEAQLNEIYKKNNELVKDKPTFIKLLGEKKEQLKTKV
jgi:hypothetical protein